MAHKATFKIGMLLPICFPEFQMRLTKQNVNQLTIPDGKSEHIEFDETLPGFGVRLRIGGKPKWIVQYRIGKKQRRITIGSVEAIDPDQARSQAKTTIAKVQLGGDPQTDKHSVRAKAKETLLVVIGTYLSTYSAANLKPNTLKEVRRSLMAHWKPLHEVQVHTLTRGMIASRLGEIAIHNGPFASNRSRAYLSAMLNWAVTQGLLESNPAHGTGKIAKEVARERVLSDDELALVLKHAGSGDYGAIIRLLILTGQRREEVAAMEWGEIDFSRAIWSIPGSRTKNKLPHDVPLSAEVIAILQSVIRREQRPWVFGSGDGPFSGWSKSKAALDARINNDLNSRLSQVKTAQSWRVHDLRRTVTTRMGDLGVLPHVVEATLNHISGHKAGVAGVYNRSVYSKEKHSALEVWGKHVSSLITL